MSPMETGKGFHLYRDAYPERSEAVHESYWAMMPERERDPKRQRVPLIVGVAKVEHGPISLGRPRLGS
jgi:hypothetical protein